MVVDSFTKELSPSNLGETGMNDYYITFKSRVDYLDFYGNESPRQIVHVDRSTEEEYTFRYERLESDREVRLYQMRDFFQDKTARPNDVVRIEKDVENSITTYYIDIVRSEVPYESGEFLPDEVNEEETHYYTEGSKMAVYVNKYERNPRAREACLEHYGTTCAVCSFDFEAIFGEIGEGFIHVHHLKPVAEIGETYTVNPINDLIPVCPNCHAMIHKRNPPYTIDELKEIIE